MAFSFSSDTSTQEVKEDLIILMTRSLDRTSSFFTWSPVTLVLPAMPYLPLERRRANITKLQMKQLLFLHFLGVPLFTFLTSKLVLPNGAYSPVEPNHFL